MATTSSDGSVVYTDEEIEAIPRPYGMTEEEVRARCSRVPGRLRSVATWTPNIIAQWRMVASRYFPKLAILAENKTLAALFAAEMRNGYGAVDPPVLHVPDPGTLDLCRPVADEGEEAERAGYWAVMQATSRAFTTKHVDKVMEAMEELSPGGKLAVSVPVALPSGVPVAEHKDGGIAACAMATHMDQRNSADTQILLYHAVYTCLRELKAEDTPAMDWSIVPARDSKNNAVMVLYVRATTRAKLIKRGQWDGIENNGSLGADCTIQVLRPSESTSAARQGILRAAVAAAEQKEQEEQEKQ